MRVDVLDCCCCDFLLLWYTPYREFCEKEIYHIEYEGNA